MNKKTLLFLTALFYLLAGITDAASVQGRYTIPLNGSGWKLWMDKEAVWKNDQLYLPNKITDLSVLPMNAPTGGWKILNEPSFGHSVNVPGTVEQYFTSTAEPRPEHQAGVSWWWRTIKIPKEMQGRRIKIYFESVRMRAEVYLDGRLVAYDLVGESPFDADITDAVQYGKEQTLAVRVTNPGGNFHWQDFTVMHWGNYLIPPGRGFGGIIGRVKIECLPSGIHIDDVYIQNTPNLHRVNAIITLTNEKNQNNHHGIEISVCERRHPYNVVYSKTVKNISIGKGEQTLEVPIKIPDAKLWDLDSPDLYICRIALKKGGKITDNYEQTFGFRWFQAEGIGKDAVLRLNGKRIVLRSAISWGYFPSTGLIATKEVAARQVITAKQLGLNMLNFHRSIGSPVVLEAADSLGLLYYEEPGAFHSAPNDPFIRTLVNEKLHRMIKRDRSHPSLIIYNLINEFGGPLTKDSTLVALRMNDMRQAHSIDPSRTMTFTSGWASKENSDEDSKANMQPYDTTLYRHGWFDNHRAGGPSTYEENFYKGPKENLMYTENKTEVFMRGEEGAISTPPRIQQIHNELLKTKQMGWDGHFWEHQYNCFHQFFEEKKLSSHFGNIDNLTQTMGNVQFEHQGRRIQGMRMQNIGDCYVINGWESMPYDNHSGIVDIYRNPKGSTDVLSYFNQPLYVAVTTRNQVVRLPGNAIVDLWLVNEKDIRGDYKVHLYLIAPNGQRQHISTENVHIQGGDVYGQLLVEGIKVSLTEKEGIHRLEAWLTTSDDIEVCSGHDEILGVHWTSSDLQGRGAYYGYPDDPVAKFYQQQTGVPLLQFSDNLEKLDWLVVNRSLLDEPVCVDFKNLQNLKVTWFGDDDMRKPLKTKKDICINRLFTDGAQPDECIPANEKFSVVWEGEIIPEKTGMYLIGLQTHNGIRLDLNGQRLIDKWNNNNQLVETRPVKMEAGKPVKIHIEYRQITPNGDIKLVWSMPDKMSIPVNTILDKAYKDGTTVILLGQSETWMQSVADFTGLKYEGYYSVGQNWIGGIHFVKDHPLFNGLPVNTAMNWPYQAVVHQGDNRLGYMLHGEDMVVGSYRSWPFHLGTAVGVIPYGKGKIIFSTLDIAGNLLSEDPTAEVARKLFCNYINYR